MKVKLCVRLSQYFFILLILTLFSNCESESFDSDSNTNINTNPHSNPIKISECSLNCEDLIALQKDNRDLKKSHMELIEQVKSLSKRFDELKKERSSDRGVWLLSPPPRGPIGKKGEAGPAGEKGEPGRKGEIGQNGQAGEKGDMGWKGQEGKAGTPGRNGDPGIKGAKGDRGVSGSQGQYGAKGERGSVGPKGNTGVTDQQTIKNCDDAMKNLPFVSRQLSIYPYQNNKRVQVLCDFETDGGGWTIIQKRSSGPQQEFNRTWNDYKNGFGFVDKNFWIGLENIHALTKNGDQELRIELEDHDGRTKHVKYSSFYVSAVSFTLTISGFSGNTGDGMKTSDSTRWHNNMYFSTPDSDRDHDRYSGGHCGAIFGGGWWYNWCLGANLNGFYREKGETVPYAHGIIWSAWKGYHYSLAKTEMKIRTRR